MKVIDAVIVEAVRTPIGKKNGLLSRIRAEDLAAEPLKELIKRTGIDPALIDDVIFGCVTQSGEQGGVIARQAALIAGYSMEVPGTTIDRQCGSSQQAVHFAAEAIIRGDMDIVVAGGVESMSRVPMLSNREGVDYSTGLTEKHDNIKQGRCTERIVEKRRGSGEELDQSPVARHEKASHAQKSGSCKDEIMRLAVVLTDGTKQI